VEFHDISRTAGLEVTNVNGASDAKHLTETMGSGGLFFDYDNDGWIDIFLVDGGSVTDAAIARTARHRLFHNRRNGTFADVTETSGIRHREYGMGTCAGDVDNDGWVDLYVTNFGPNVLYRNQGDGTFADVTRAARVGTALWSTSCAFADLDRDGDLDLFVTNYVNAKPDESPFCGNARLKYRTYCHPLNFDPLPSVLYRNDGKGVFTDMSTPTGVGAHRGNGLGVVIADFDEDGRPDIFVANDGVPNFLYFNEGNWKFTEAALPAGVAVASDGRPRAGMGTDAADYDGDGHLDLVVTNHEFETHGLYRNLGRRLFAYTTPESGIGPPTLPFVGFGVAFLDYDNDAALDIAIVNGHVLDKTEVFRTGASHAQRNLLFRNVNGKRFADVSRASGPALLIEKVSRGLAAGDIDNDGDLDLLVTNNGGRADLLLNQGGSANSALLVRLIGKASNRDAVGAVLRLSTGQQTLTRSVKAGSSYLSQNDMRVHFGLGRSARAGRLEIVWPSGRVEVLEGLAAGQIVTIREGEGIVAATPFRR
jgi:hypothetical protein